MMKKRRLEIALQKLRPLETRSSRLEQYPTPAQVAADVLWEAYSAGDVAGRCVADLGCGNGVFCIGAMMLGARRAVGVDIDPNAVSVAKENAASVGVEVELLCQDVSEMKGEFDTVIQNPPFGAQTRHADRAFIKKGLELAPKCYSLHNDGTQDFVQQMVASLGGRAEPVKRYKFEIPYAFEFHRKTVMSVSVLLFKLER